jgi:hypothetical protein
MKQNEASAVLPELPVPTPNIIRQLSRASNLTSQFVISTAILGIYRTLLWIDR